MGLFNPPSPPPPAPVKTPEQIASDAEAERKKAAVSAADSIAASNRQNRPTVRNVVTGLFIPGVSDGY